MYDLTLQDWAVPWPSKSRLI